MSGLPVEPLYTPDDLAGWSYDEKLGYPGEFPYTRGVYPSMYRGQLWTIRQFAGYGSAQETNRRYQFLLKQGQAGLSVAFDMPTLMGYDSDDPLSQGEVGHCGVAIDSLEDMEMLFQDIQLDQITTSMTINSPAAILYAMYIAVGEKEGLKPAQLGGTLQNDILKEYIAQSTRSCSRPARCRAGTRSPSPGTTSGKRAQPPPRSSPSRWPTAWPTSRRRSRRG